MTGFFGKSWTIGEIYNTSQERQFKSNGCSVTYQGVTRTIEKVSILDRWKSLFFRNKSMMNTLSVVFKFNVMSNESGKSYTVFIKVLYDPYGNLVMDGKVQVYCGCPDFKFGSAYELNNHKSLYRSEATDIELGPAITTAPKKRKNGGILCKHAYAALSYFIGNYQTLMSYV